MKKRKITVKCDKLADNYCILFMWLIWFPNNWTKLIFYVQSKFGNSIDGVKIYKNPISNNNMTSILNMVKLVSAVLKIYNAPTFITTVENQKKVSL